MAIGVKAISKPSSEFTSVVLFVDHFNQKVDAADIIYVVPRISDLSHKITESSNTITFYYEMDVTCKSKGGIRKFSFAPPKPVVVKTAIKKANEEKETGKSKNSEVVEMQCFVAARQQFFSHLPADHMLSRALSVLTVLPRGVPDKAKMLAATKQLPKGLKKMLKAYDVTLK
jgi:hypothetical protein